MEGWEEGKGRKARKGGRQIRGPGATTEGSLRSRAEVGRGPRHWANWCWSPPLWAQFKQKPTKTVKD